MSHYESEIFEQPAVMQRFLDEKLEVVQKLAQDFRREQPRFVLISARGTSDNASTYAKYLFGALLGIPVGLAVPSLYTLYNQPPDVRQGLVIGISQSGESPDVLAVVQEAARQQAPTLAIVNRAGSPLGHAAKELIELGAGEERAVAASKTFTAELLAVAALAAFWKEDPALIADLQRLPALAAQALEEQPKVQAAAQRFASQDRMIVVGRGFNHCTVFEVALKIKELSYVSADAYSAADFQHGPIALVEPGFPIWAVAPHGPALDSMRATIREVTRLGAETAVVSNDEELLQASPLAIQLPKDLPEWLSPLIGVISGQLMALHLAQARGYDPDAPRSLRKITRTT